jgi:hypothetical protein
MNVSGVILALVALVVVAAMAYRAGYLRGQVELLRQRQSTEPERTARGMKAALPRWRRVAGWAAYTCSGLLLCLFLFLAFSYAKRWGWAVLIATWALWFALFLGGIWLAEWCWRPYREAYERLRHEETKTRKALEGRASEEDST